MEILAAKKPRTDVQEFKNLKFRFKRGGEQVQASEHTENNNVQVHEGTQMLHNKWKEKQVRPKTKKKNPQKITVRKFRFCTEKNNLMKLACDSLMQSSLPLLLFQILKGVLLLW
jgi:hypothetical protein